MHSVSSLCARNLFESVAKPNRLDRQSRLLSLPAMTPRELEAEITRLLKSGMDDRSLRNELDALAEKEPAFPGFTWFWGPILYRRNRTLFRPFILSRFSRWMLLPKRKAEVIHYRKQADRLGFRSGISEPWQTMTGVSAGSENQLTAIREMENS